jgi:hypothetical protein
LQKYYYNYNEYNFEKENRLKLLNYKLAFVMFALVCDFDYNIIVIDVVYDYYWGDDGYHNGDVVIIV